MSVFERLAAVSRSTTERVHGKAITIYPLTGNDENASASVSLSDPDAWETVGCFFENTLMESDRSAQPSDGGRRMMQRSLQKQVSIRLVAGKKLRTAFLMRRHDDDAWFTITSFDPDGLGTVLALIAPAKPSIVVDEVEE